MKLEEIVLKSITEQVIKKATEQNLTEEQSLSLIEAAVKAALTDGLAKTSSLLANNLRQQIPEIIASEQTMREGFEQRLYERWKKALDLYEVIVILTRESGEIYVKQYAWQAAKDNDLVFRALKRIHIRACQTAEAVAVLLKSGFARDALARQRTLHELAVTAFFIKKHGPETAERYWLHNTILSYKAAIQYEQYCQRLGYEPHDPADLDKLRTQKEAIVDRFGKSFYEDYGWAAQALEKDRGVRFTDIEMDVKLDHLRPYYRMASYGVHVNSKGLIFDIGSPNHNTPLAGASNAGLADPGQLALISLQQCTTAFLTYQNDFETLIKLKVLESFVNEAKQAFIETHRNLEREEKERSEAMQISPDPE